MAEPTPPFDVKAIAAYAARNDAEVSLEVGKVYSVLQTDGKGLWWQTKGPGGNIGWFPASYTEIYVKPVAAPPPPMPMPAAAPSYQQPSYQQPAYQQQQSYQTPAPTPQPRAAPAPTPQPRPAPQPTPQYQTPASPQPQYNTPPSSPQVGVYGSGSASNPNLYTPRNDAAQSNTGPMSSPVGTSSGGKEKPGPPSRPPTKEKDETPAFIKLQSTPPRSPRRFVFGVASISPPMLDDSYSSCLFIMVFVLIALLMC